MDCMVQIWKEAEVHRQQIIAGWLDIWLGHESVSVTADFTWASLALG